ncbi:MAG: D-glycerate dehydrogenase [Candidatus Uhrbacteria bacterium]|nr:D-glycerate dehydrogenase [Candidatus Uhrbacteria bacterium]
MSNVLIGFNPKGFADDAVEILKKAKHKVTVMPASHNIDQKDLIKAAKGKDAVLTLLSNRIDDAFFKAVGPQLKIVANYAVGFDNIDLEAAKKHKVIVTNTPSDVVNESVAEHTFALMIALAHRVAEAHIFTTHGEYKGWTPDLFLGNNLKGRTLGLIGAGRIGGAVAERAYKGFGMNVIYSDLNKNADIEKNAKAKHLPMDKVLAQADIVSIHVPLFPSTRHLISTREFSLMKKGSLLINTARGPIVDEKALCRALKTKRIAGAGIDVFECEPAIDCDLTDNLELRAMPNAVLTPHIASATYEARADMAIIAAKNIVAVLAGKKAISPAK